MRISLSVAGLALAAGCVHAPNPVALKHWYPPPDVDTVQLCTGERARRCVDQANSLIAPDAPEKQPDRAARLLGAACEEREPRACSTLDARFVGPKRLDPLPEGIGHGLPHASASYGEVACTVTVAGEAVKCRGLQNGGYNPQYIDALLRVRFVPAMFDGAPFESEYIERYFIPSDT